MPSGGSSPSSGSFKIDFWSVDAGCPSRPAREGREDLWRSDDIDSIVGLSASSELLDDGFCETVFS
jgi:hypothetical protein